MDIGTIVDEYSKESMLQANPTLLLSLNLVRTALHQEISCLNSLETYIHLLMPQMEDGNNFGVTVQMTVLKVMEEVKEKLEKKLEEIPSYFSKRADAVDKLGLACATTSETKTESSSNSTGGKDGDESKTSTTTTKEDKTSGNKTMEFHRIQHVYAIDIQTYSVLKSSLAFCISSFLVILDNIEKNKEKIEQPKGSSGGSNFSSMY